MGSGQHPKENERKKGKRNRHVFLRQADQQNLKVAGRDCTSGYMEEVSVSLPRR